MNFIKSNIIQLHGAANSMQGGKPENQDDMAFLDTPLGFLAIICDGMGGGPGGKTASYIAKNEIASIICKCSPQTPRDYAFKMAISRANEALEKKMQEVPLLQGMGSTVVAVLINKDSAYIAHAGDSRCYLLRGDKCVYQSQDHSLVGELVRKKALTEEEARLSPQSNVISRGLGSTTNHVPEIEEIPYRKGDRIVLCTDGVWGIMPHRELVKRFVHKIDIQQVISNISSEIDNIGYSKGGHHDNHTIAIFEIGLNSNLKEKVNWKKISIACSIICITLAVITYVLVFISNSNKPSTSFLGTTSGNTNQGDYSGKYSPASGRDTTSIKNDTDSTPKTIPTDSLKKLIKSKNKREQEMSEQHDSTLNDTSRVPNKPSEITQKVINRYQSAKAVEDTTTNAQKRLNGLHKEIKTLMNELHKQCEDSVHRDVLPTVEEIDRNVNNTASWYIDKEINKTTGKYKPTQRSQELMDKQIERLTELKSKL